MLNLLKSPICILDSGIGGVSVAQTIMETLKEEDILYFGDTNHMPYGKKSLLEVQDYTTKIIDFFIEQHCKLIIIACNTASAATQDIINNYHDKIKIFNVIDPVINYIVKNYAHRKVGLICTDLTHELGIFEKKIEDQGDDIKLISLRASQLAHLIETEFENKEKLEQLIREYFFHNQFKNIQAVILGCTHYVWLKKHFLELNPLIDWVEPSNILAEEVKKYLTEQGKLNKATKDNSFSNAVFCQSSENAMFFDLAEKLTPAYYNKYYISNLKISS